MIDAKALQRTQLRQQYACLDTEYKTKADEQIILRVLDFPIYQSAGRIFLYASAGNEVNTHPLLRKAYEDGKIIVLPKCYGRGIMDFYRYHGELHIGKYNIPEPVSEEIVYPNADDIMIVPGLAFTSQGVRLGQGGGYYDRYLEKYPCITVGLCRRQFIKTELPVSWNDLPVDYVITETMVYERKNGAS